MAIVLNSTSSGAQGIFNRLGRIGNTILLLNEFCGRSGSLIATDLPAEISDTLAYFDGVTNMAIRNTVINLLSTVDGMRSMAKSVCDVLGQSGQALLIEQVDADNGLPKRTVAAALEELRLQMVAGPATVDASEPSIGQSFAGTGNGALVLSLLDGRGRTLENAFAETLDLICTTAAANAGTFTLTGEAAETDLLSWNWPQGSGASKTLSCIAASASQNKISNGTFETFTVANQPDGWTLGPGAAGSQVFSEASVVYRGSKSLRMLGDGSTLSQVKQTLTGLSARTPYAFNMFCRNSTNPAAGVLTVDLYDGASVINDDAGTPNSFTVNATTLGTSFVPKSGVFRLPAAVPSTVELRIRQSTAITNTHSLYLDDACLQAMTNCYDGGPYGALFAGSTNFAIDDKFLLAVTNAYEGAIQQLFYRLFGQPLFLLPSATGGLETIPDSLIGA